MKKLLLEYVDYTSEGVYLSSRSVNWVLTERDILVTSTEYN